MSATARRRRAVLVAIAAAAAIAGAIVGARSDSGERSATTAAPAGPQCPGAIASDDRRLVGQMLVVRMELTATPFLREAARRGELGGVILFPPEGADPLALGREIEALREAAARGANVQPLMTIDQEGGQVKRLPSLAPAVAPAELKGTEAARKAGSETGRDLARLGIDVDLAPVLDVPATPESAIATRAFGDDPRSVTSEGLAFADGLQRAGVAATAKHFPGLGQANLNTDDVPVTIAAARRDLAREMRPFAAAIGADIGLLMVANATYQAYDPARPASLSRRLIDGLLRSRLGYEGVVITDDLGAGAITGAGYREGKAAVAAARAGADLLLFALSDGDEARRALLRALRAGRLDREVLIRSCARTSALRERFGARVSPSEP